MIRLIRSCAPWKIQIGLWEICLAFVVSATGQMAMAAAKTLGALANRSRVPSPPAE